jgi:hypothetical protein
MSDYHITWQLVQFVAAFDPEFAEEIVSQLIREMFAFGILQIQASDFDYQNKMTSELALLWRLYCEHLKTSQVYIYIKSGNIFIFIYIEKKRTTQILINSTQRVFHLISLLQREDLLDISLPELVVFCQLLAKHKDNHFITKQLLLFSDLLDLKDEAGKKTLSNLLRICHPLTFIHIPTRTHTHTRNSQLFYCYLEFNRL